MSTERPVEQPLAELSDDRIDEIEDALFADIAADRTRRRRRRGRVWLAGGAAAGVIAVAAIVAPTIGGMGMTTYSSSDAAIAPVVPGIPPEAVPLEGAAVDGLRLDAGTIAGSAADMGSTPQSATAGRDIITSASATVVVADPAAAARAVGDAAAARGGYVESMSVGSSGQGMPVDPSTGMVYGTTPYTPDGAWITVRVPSDQLAPLVVELSDVGEVTASSTDRQDVTEQTVDLQARIDAAQASVDRLTQLMAQAGSVGDLIAAETALSERQATLESYQQQLKSLEGMVDMSSLTVTLTPERTTVEADPAGFGDGIAAGWNGLVATLNGIVIGLGFLLPWIAVVAVVVLVVWGIVRLTRRTAPRSPEGSSD